MNLLLGLRPIIEFSLDKKEKKVAHRRQKVLAGTGSERRKRGFELLGVVRRPPTPGPKPRGLRKKALEDKKEIAKRYLGRESLKANQGIYSEQVYMIPTCGKILYFLLRSPQP